MATKCLTVLFFYLIVLVTMTRAGELDCFRPVLGTYKNQQGLLFIGMDQGQPILQLIEAISILSKGEKKCTSQNIGPLFSSTSLIRSEFRCENSRPVILSHYIHQVSFVADANNYDQGWGPIKEQIETRVLDLDSKSKQLTAQLSVETQYAPFKKNKKDPFPKGGVQLAERRFVFSNADIDQLQHVSSNIHQIDSSALLEFQKKNCPKQAPLNQIDVLFAGDDNIFGRTGAGYPDQFIKKMEKMLKRPLTYLDLNRPFLTSGNILSLVRDVFKTQRPRLLVAMVGANDFFNFHFKYQYQNLFKASDAVSKILSKIMLGQSTAAFFEAYKLPVSYQRSKILCDIFKDLHLIDPAAYFCLTESQNLSQADRRELFEIYSWMLTERGRPHQQDKDALNFDLKALKSYSKSEDLWLSYAFKLAQAQRFKDAKDALKKARRLMPKSPTTDQITATLLLKMRAYQELVDEIDETMKHAPMPPSDYFIGHSQLLLALAQVGNFSSAKSYVEKFKSIYPQLKHSFSWIEKILLNPKGATPFPQNDPWSERYNSLTLKNIETLIKEANALNVTVAVVGQPWQDLHWLKEKLNLSKSAKVVWVENITNFKQALDRYNFLDLFNDNAQGHFGEFAQISHELLAENLFQNLDQQKQFLLFPLTVNKSF